MSKNLLSENMLRFGTKNLSEWQQRELIVKSIMETINQHGLHGDVRNRLMEQSPKKGAVVDIMHPSKGSIKYPVPTDSGNVGKAMKIIGQLLKAMVGVGTDNKLVQTAVYSIKDMNTYASVLWRVQHSTMIKSEYGENFNLIGTFISTDWTKAGGGSATGNTPAGKRGIGSPQAAVQDATGYGAMYRDVERHLQQFNENEYIKTWRPG